MKKYIILDKTDMLILGDNKPITFYIDKKPYIFCTEEYFEKQIIKSQKSEITNNETSTRKTEHWIGDKSYSICPKCNCNIIEEYISYSDYAEMYKPMKYCPNCGTKMEVEE